MDPGDNDGSDFLPSNGAFQPFGSGDAHAAMFQSSSNPSTITHFGYDGTNVTREWSEYLATDVLTLSAWSYRSHV